MPLKLLVCLIKRFIVLNAADSSVNNQSDKGLAFESTRIKKSKGTHGGQGMIVAPTVPNTASKGILGAQLSVHLPKHLQSQSPSIPSREHMVVRT